MNCGSWPQGFRVETFFLSLYVVGMKVDQNSFLNVVLSWEEISASLE